jgi:hypothetical protein
MSRVAAKKQSKNLFEYSLSPIVIFLGDSELFTIDLIMERIINNRIPEIATPSDEGSQ